MWLLSKIETVNLHLIICIITLKECLLISRLFASSNYLFLSQVSGAWSLSLPTTPHPPTTNTLLITNSSPLISIYIPTYIFLFAPEFQSDLSFIYNLLRIPVSSYAFYQSFFFFFFGLGFIFLFFKKNKQKQIKIFGLIGLA